jgi:hypothetical protein
MELAIYSETKSEKSIEQLLATVVTENRNSVMQPRRDESMVLLEIASD